MNINAGATPKAASPGVKEFVLETLQRWYGAKDCAGVHLHSIIRSPEDVDWHRVAEDIDREKFGEYMLDPATLSVQWENVPVEKFRILDFHELVDQTLSDVMEQVVVLYGSSHYLPGLECQRHLTKDTNRAFDVLKGGRCYFFPGSVIRNLFGYVTLPYSVWAQGALVRESHGLFLSWKVDSRIVLVEK